MPTINHAVINNSNPAEYAEAVIPNDAADLPQLARALYVGVGGDVAIQTSNGTNVTFVGFSGGFFPVRVKKLMQTNTTATNIIALY